MNAGGSGFSVGNLATMSISGTLPYYLNNLDNLSEIQLYQRGSPIGDTPIWNLRYEWRLKNATLTERSSFTFSGVDAMAFTNNDYALRYAVQQSTGLVYYDSIGQQTATAETTISTLSSMTVSVQRCSSDSVNNYSQCEKQTIRSIKSLLEEIAKFDAVNYYTRCTDVNTATLKKASFSQVVIDEYAPLSVGQYNPPITYYEISGSDNTASPTYTYGTPSTPYSVRQTLKVTASFVDSLKELVETEDASGQTVNTPTPRKIAPANYESMGVRGSGRQFTCQKAFVEDLFESGEFLVPMCYIRFDHESYQDNQFILTSAQYFLTSEGIYASLSGSARSVSDFEYVGTTAQRVMNKVNMNYNYGGATLTEAGIIWDQHPDTVLVNSG